MISDFPRGVNGRLTGFNEKGTYERQYLATFALQDHSEDFHPDDLYQYSLVSKHSHSNCYFVQLT